MNLMKTAIYLKRMRRGDFLEFFNVLILKFHPGPGISLQYSVLPKKTPKFSLQERRGAKNQIFALLYFMN